MIEVRAGALRRLAVSALVATSVMASAQAFGKAREVAPHEWEGAERVVVLGDVHGRYRDEIVNEDGSIVRLRKEHGVHFLEVGADMLAEQLEERLVADGWLAAR